MRIISRYLLFEFLRVLILATVFFLAVFFVVDFIEKIDNFLEAGVAVPRVLYYYLMLIPSLLFYMAPVAVLVSLLISLGLLARRSEIVVMKASGISLTRLSLPFLLVTLLISLLLFILSDTVIPRTAAVVNQIWEVEVEKHGGEEGRIHRSFWLRESGAFYHIQYHKEGDPFALGVKVYFINDRFKLARRVEAERVEQRDGAWVFLKGLIKETNAQGEIQIRPFEEDVFPFPSLDREFVQTPKAVDELSAAQLDDRIDRMAAEGHDPIRYIVDLHFKYSFPFICAIMAVIGLPIAFWKEKGGGVALGIGVGIGLSFIYLVFLGLARSLGYSGALPPVAAAWLANLVFSVLGLYLFTHVRQ